MSLIGHAALVVAFALAIANTWIGAAAGRARVYRHAQLSLYGVIALAALIALAAVALLHGFLSHDFALRYVHGRSDTRMPLGYLIASFWGGQEGSLLLWVAVTSSLAAAAAWINRDRLPRVMPWFHAAISLLLACFLFILVFVTDPFASWAVIDTPIEGTGLKAALRDPLMMIHPPMLLSGFAAFAIPWAFAMAALLAGDTSADWLKATRAWTLFAWCILGLGNLLGGMWAYRELGWGGYWAWDPVENAGLLPWLTGTAFLHSVIIQEQRGMLKRWNVFLVMVTFLLTLFGTFLTRSGMIDSVHTFAESEIGDFFLALFLLMTAFSAALAAARWHLLEGEAEIESPISREGAFLANNWLFVGMAFVVLWGTLFPKLKELITGIGVTIGPPWFNRFMGPLGLVLLVILLVGTLLPWRRATLAHLKKHFTIPVAVALIATPALAVPWWIVRGQHLLQSPFGWQQSFALIAFALILANTAAIVMEFVRGASVRGRKAGVGIGSAVLDLFRRHRRRYGGYIAHIGILCIFLAFLGNAVKADQQLTLRLGEAVSLGDYVVRFEHFRIEEGPDHVRFVADMGLYRAGRDGAPPQRFDTLQPSRSDFNNYALLGDRPPDPLNLRSNIFIRSTPLEDVYIALLNFDQGGQAAAFKLVILPFTWWAWFGGLVLLLGTLICMWPESRERWRSFAGVGAWAGALFAASLALAGMPASGAAQTAEHVPLSETVHVHHHGPHARYAFDMIMTTCSGCAGKTLSLASPSCHPSNLDKQRIAEMEQSGMTGPEIVDVFVAERGPAARAIPPDQGWWRVHWALPSLGLLAAAALLFFLSRRWSHRAASRSAVAPSPEDDDDLALSPEDMELRRRIRADLAAQG